MYNEIMKFTPRLEKAIRTATMAHRNQKRKGSDLPYIIHAYGVMCIASQVTDDEDIFISCLFHDILEDVPEEYSEEQMLKDFGERVVNIVKGVTKDDSLLSWQERADAYLYHLANVASDESVVVSCADKIHNVMSILNDYELVGDKLWERFKGDKEQQQWWYVSVLSITKSRLPNFALNEQLSAYVNKLSKL
jgi:(p)ppGpp synthase/HD superfamily hydrolase